MVTASDETATWTQQKKGLIRVRPDQVDDVVAFQQAAYPHRRNDWIKPRWRWMYLASARRLDVESMVWAYHDGERIVAHQGAISVRLKVGSREVTTGWFVETMTLESARGRTVGPAVIMKAAEDLPFNLSLGQTPAMRELQYRLGWTKVADLQTAQLLLNPAAVFGNKLKSRAASAAAGAVVRLYSTVRQGRRRDIEGVDVSEIDRFDAAHDRLWEQVGRDLTCAVVRDASYLNWKYVEQPGQSFHRLELQRAGEPVAIVVLSFTEPEETYRYRRAFLVEVVAPMNDPAILSAALEVARRHAARHQADALICHHIGHHLTAALKRAGFLMRPPTRFLLVRPGPAEPALRDAVLRSSDWFVTMGDSDIDRPW